MKRTLAACATTAVLLPLAACGGGGSVPTGSNPNGSSGSSVQAPANTMGVKGAPPTLAGYQSFGGWTSRLNTAAGQFRAAAGPGGTPWPTTPGNCADQWFQIRWHAANPQATFVAGYGTSGSVTSKSSPASSGWLSIDGCQTPQWKPSSGPANEVVISIELDQPNS